MKQRIRPLSRDLHSDFSGLASLTEMLPGLDKDLAEYFDRKYEEQNRKVTEKPQEEFQNLSKDSRKDKDMAYNCTGKRYIEDGEHSRTVDCGAFLYEEEARFVKVEDREYGPFCGTCEEEFKAEHSQSVVA